MAVRLIVLSGSLQGHVLETREKVIGIGSDTDNLMRFNLESDPEIRGQRIRLELRDDRWRLFNYSEKPVFINQDLVRADAGLRSGDLIRLSQDGPDLQFELEFSKSTEQASLLPENNQLSDSTAVEPIPADSEVRPTSEPCSKKPVHHNTLDSLDKSRDAPRHESTETRPPSRQIPVKHVQNSKSIPREKRKPRKRPRNSFAYLITFIAVPAGGLAGICIAVVLLWVIWKKDPLGVIATPATTRPNGSALDLQPRQESKPVDATDQKPRTSTDASRQSSASTPDRTPKISATSKTDFKIAVFEPKTVDILTTPTYALDLSQSILNAANKTLSFQTDSNTPRGVVIDPLSGLLTWAVPPRLAGQSIDIPFLVESTGSPGSLKRGMVSLQVKCGDNKTTLKPTVFDSIYLLAAQTEPEHSYLPLGTACSIAPYTLLTSATVAMALIDAEKRDWTIAALTTASDPETDVQSNKIESVQVHRIYHDAIQRADAEGRALQQAYFDLAILKTADAMLSSVPLRKTRQGQINAETFTCLGYPINGKTLTNLSRLRPTRHESKLKARIPPKNSQTISASSPLLLQLEGAMQTNNFGGVLVNTQSEVVGVYTFSAPLNEETESPGVYYATETVAAQSFLHNIGTDFWVSVYDHSKTQ